MAKRCGICPMLLCGFKLEYIGTLTCHQVSEWTQFQKRVKADGPKCRSIHPSTSQGPHNVRQLQGAAVAMPSLSSKPFFSSSHQVYWQKSQVKILSQHIFLFVSEYTLMSTIHLCALYIVDAIWLSPPGTWRLRTSPAYFDSTVGFSIDNCR